MRTRTRTAQLAALVLVLVSVAAVCAADSGRAGPMRELTQTSVARTVSGGTVVAPGAFGVLVAIAVLSFVGMCGSGVFVCVTQRVALMDD